MLKFKYNLQVILRLSFSSNRDKKKGKNNNKHLEN